MNQELKKTIGTIKVAKGITQSEIATAIGVKPTYLSDMINDRVPYSASMKKRIYEIYSDCLPAPNDAPPTEQHGDNKSVFARTVDYLLGQICEKDEIIAQKDAIIKELNEKLGKYICND